MLMTRTLVDRAPADGPIHNIACLESRDNAKLVLKQGSVQKDLLNR